MDLHEIARYVSDRVDIPPRFAHWINTETPPTQATLRHMRESLLHAIS